MRDLVEINHQQYIWKHPYYYKESSFFEIALTDYYYTYVRAYMMDVPHNVVGKAPWTYIYFYNSQKLDAGWKIHISSEINTHIDVLKAVACYACEKKIDFKFSSNLKQFIDINSKNISRSSSGKFIVLYPKQKDFLIVIEDLYKLLRKYKGPYILSDMAYKDSKVVFYRYGEINPIRYTDEYGTMTTRILNASNMLEVDERKAFYSKPQWVSEIVQGELDSKTSKLLKKYSITSALHFSAQGGVYVAQKDSSSYVIKEARAYAGIDNNKKSGSERLKNEYAILKELADSKITPLPIELAEEFGNTYLVEEFLEGNSLRSYPHRNSPYVNMVNDTEEMEKKYREFGEELNTIIRESLRGISQLHEKKIALGDISPSNIIYNKERKNVKFIDLETAFHFVEETEVYHDTLMTPGFSIGNVEKTILEIELYKMGLVFLYLIEPYNGIFHLSRKKVEETLDLFRNKTCVPINVLELIDGLVNFRFESAKHALQVYEENAFKERKNQSVFRYEIDYDKVYKSIYNNIVDAMLESKDILATDPMGIVTNKYCFSYGLFGMLYAMKKYSNYEKMEDMLLKVVHDFMRNFYYNPKNFSRGLFVGLSGIAYCMLELGFEAEAEIVMEEILHTENSLSDYSYGSAGVISVLLKFYQNTGQEKYINAALKEADCIMKNANVENGKMVWKDLENDVYAGLTRGGAGIALVFLQLYSVTKKDKYLIFGEKALQGDLSKLKVTENGFIGIDSKRKDAKTSVYSPYIHNGIAGIGCVLVRYFKYTGKQQYLAIINDIIKACTSQMILFTGYLRGAVGLLSFFQDCLYILDIKNVEDNIKKCYESLDYHYVVIDEKAGYAGDELYKISHDLHTGSAGVILSVFRSRNQKKENPFLVFDEVFEYK